MGEVVEYVPQMYATFWALVPPIVAICLALITKEVYSSLFVGIVIGGLFYSGFSFEGTVLHVFQDGIVGVLTDSYNMGILVFLVILGAMVCMMNKAGGSAAFGHWASTHIKTRAGAQIATIALGILIFIDDYFNCLTVGSVMRPVTDKHNVSRAKLAYLIDATAAPVCIIAPISSWAAAVTGFVEGEDGFGIFIRAIPYNYYALLTILAMFLLVLTKVDFGPMKKHEENALKGDLYTTEDRPYATAEKEVQEGTGKVVDLVFPIIALIVCCVLGMIYTGGFFQGVGFVEAFSASDASVGLMLGSFFGMLITVIFYQIRKVLKFTDSMSCIPEGFKAMVPAILILTFAWTLKAMTDSLGAKEFVAGVVKGASGSFLSLLPAIIFLVACFLAFATRNFLGNIRYPDSYRSKRVCRNQRDHDDYFHFRLYGRCGLWRPLFTDFRYHDYVLGGSAVQSFESCIYTNSLCGYGSGGFLHYLCGSRICTKSLCTFDFRYSAAHRDDFRNQIH